MKKRIIATFGFFFLAAVVLLGLSDLMRDKSTTFSATYSEPDNSLDVLIVGSSHVNSGFIPNLLWENNNLSAVNTFSWSQPMWVSYHYIIEALKTQSPDVIVLEMFGMTYGHSYIMPEEIDKTSYANSFNLDMSLNRLKLIQTSERVGLDLRNASDFLYLSTYHTRWKYPDMLFNKYDAHKQHDYLKGYGYLVSCTPFERPMIEDDTSVLTPYEYCVEYLDKIVKLCNEKGIKLIFTMTPYIYAQEEYGIFNWVEQYSDENDIPFLNYCFGDDSERAMVDYSTDLSDNGHCNYNGAYKITSDLSNFLTENGYNHASKEENLYSDLLNRDYNKFTRIPGLSGVLEEKDLENWLTLSSDDKNITLFVNCDDSYNSFISQAYNIPVIEARYYIVKDGKIYSTDNTVQYNLFDKEGTVSFSDATTDIFINGTAVPTEENQKIQIVLYDEVLKRPVISVWSDNYKQLKSREFTSDIIDRYK